MAETNAGNKSSVKSSVMVIYGRNQEARISLFSLLRAFGLNPLEWNELVQATGQASPVVRDVVEKGFSMAQAAVVLFTPDDDARLKPEFASRSDEYQWHGQARQNVLIEAGMSLARYPERTILVTVGAVRLPSDLAGLLSIRLDADTACRHILAERLRTAGCSLNISGEDWLSIGNFHLIETLPSNNSTVEPPAVSPTAKSSPRLLCINTSYLVALDFAQLILHEFHELDCQGWHDVGVAARSLFRQKSVGEQPILIEMSVDNWSKNQDARWSVQINVFENLEIFIEDVDEAINNLLENTEGISRNMVASSYASFMQIQKSLAEYQRRTTQVSDCFNIHDGSLIANKIEKFTSGAMGLDRTIVRLVSKADAMIKNLLGALKFDCHFRQ